jgi:hypothetical protein
VVDCERALRRMYDRIDRLVDPWGEQQLERHLEDCADCAREYEHVLALHLFYSRQRVIDPPRDFADSVLSEIIKQRAVVPGRAHIYVDNGAAVFQAAIGSVLVYLLGWYSPRSKSVRNAFQFIGQIPSIDVTFLGSLSLPDISGAIFRVATRAAQTMTGLTESFGASLDPNVPAFLVVLVLLQLAGNKLLFRRILMEARDG